MFCLIQSQRGLQRKMLWHWPLDYFVLCWDDSSAAPDPYPAVCYLSAFVTNTFTWHHTWASFLFLMLFINLLMPAGFEVDLTEKSTERLGFIWRQSVSVFIRCRVQLWLWSYRVSMAVEGCQEMRRERDGEWRDIKVPSRMWTGDVATLGHLKFSNTFECSFFIVGSV